MLVEPISFNFYASLISGLAASAIIIALLSIWESIRYGRETLQATELAGSAITENRIATWVIGVSIILIFGCMYAIFITSFLYALQINAWLWIFGVVISIPLWIVSGTTFAYFRLLHPAVRNDRISHPGPFALSKSREAAIELLAAHMIFGAIAGTIYSFLV